MSKCSNTFHSTIIMNPTHILTLEINDQDPEFKIGSIIRISKYRNIIAKGYIPNWSDFFIIKIVKNTCRGHMLLVILKAKKLLERFTKKNCKELIKKV